MRSLFLFICLLALLNHAEAQDKPILVTGQFEQMRLPDFFSKIESQTSVYFYYDKIQVDSIVVSVTADNEPLSQVLEKALKNTGLRFSTDRSNRVFITKDIQLLTSLPAGFFSRQVDQNTSISSDSVTDYGLQMKKTAKTVSENKLYEIGLRSNLIKKNVIVTGNIRNAKTGEPLVNASVFINNMYATATDAYGHYSLTVPGGKYVLNIIAIGMKDTHLQIMVYNDGNLDADIAEQVVTLKEVIVSSKKTANITQVQMGVERLAIENIRRVPSLFGGRLSCVLDIGSREGNKKQITGSAGIGIVTSRLNIEGPLIKDRTSFIVGARTTYANWLLNLLPQQYQNSKASFQDFNLSINHRIDSTSQLFLSGYFSNDRFALNSDTTYAYSNRNANLKWKKSFNNKLSALFIGGADQYQYKVFSEKNPVNAYTLKFDIQQLFLKTDFVYYRNQQHSFDLGASVLMYKLRPGSLEPNGNGSAVIPDELETQRALESGVYLTHRFNPNNKLSISTGLRYSLFSYLGPQSVNYYAPGLPVSSDNVIETKTYGKGDFIKTYQGPEIRFSIRYAFSNDFSIKAGYNSQRQYIHMLSNTTAIAPTDIWKLSDPNIKPQLGDQVSLGFYKNLKSNTIETSVEVYYKNIRDYLDYKPGASLIMNHTIETEVINTKGKAYGLELLIKKPGGKFNGWISYTYSRILLQSSDPELATSVNKGAEYPANYDKPHDFTIMATFRVNHRFSLSLNSTYSTGRPITLPIGRYYYAGSQRVLYSERNAYRIPDYMRTDFAMNIEGNHKEHQRTHNSWTIGVYNLLGRKNPYSVYFVSENGAVNGYKLSIFGSAIPFVNFNIRF